MPAIPRSIAVLIGAGLIAATAFAAPFVPAPASPRARTPVCDAAIRHPLEVKATVLDPLARGAVVRVRVTTTSRHALERGEVRMVSAGGAIPAGAERATFGRLQPGAAAATEFAVRIPAEGRRFLLQFRVRGDGPGGLSERGATLNLLPDGPADPGRAVTSSAGQSLVEYRARRLP